MIHILFVIFNVGIEQLLYVFFTVPLPYAYPN